MSNFDAMRRRTMTIRRRVFEAERSAARASATLAAALGTGTRRCVLPIDATRYAKP